MQPMLENKKVWETFEDIHNNAYYMYRTEKPEANNVEYIAGWNDCCHYFAAQMVKKLTRENKE